MTQMTESRRQKRVAQLVKEELSRVLLDECRHFPSLMISVKDVKMTGDLKTAHVYLSFFGSGDVQTVFSQLETRQGYFRKSIASKIKLKYNPMLFFHLDESEEYEKRINQILESAKNDK